MRFATSPEATWPGNFRDLNAAVGDRITLHLQKPSDVPRESPLGRREGDEAAASPAGLETPAATPTASATAGVSGFAAVRAMQAAAAATPAENTLGAFVNQGDAPSCSDCGSLMVRSGACYKCHNCGATSGCS